MSSKDGAPGIIVLTAPSGSGKTTIARRLIEAIRGLTFSVSATTRPIRRGEQDGREYHFLTQDAFRARIGEGAFVEYEEVYPGRFYGTLIEAVDQSSSEDPVLLDIDVLGATRVKEIFGDRALALFIQPPSYEVLEKRLRGRATETTRDLETRLERARKELDYRDRFDHAVINDDLERAVEETIRLVRTFLGRSNPEADA